MLCTCHDAPSLGDGSPGGTRGQPGRWSPRCTRYATHGVRLSPRIASMSISGRGAFHMIGARESLALGHVPHAGTPHAAKLLYLAGRA